MRRGGETNLVVHNDMNRAACAMTLQARQTETFGDNALASERSITV